MKFSNEQLTRIFGLYVGAPVKYPKWKLGATLLAFNSIKSEVYLSADNKDDVIGIGTIPYDECRLILKPLANIGFDDEHCEEISKLMVSLDYGEIHPLDVREWLLEVYGDNGCTSADYVAGFQYEALSNYLHSKGYALRFMNIDLFESGIAIQE